MSGGLESCEGGGMKLSVALLLLATACSNSSSSPRAPAEKSGRAERLRIGNLEAYALEQARRGPQPLGSGESARRSPDQRPHDEQAMRTRPPSVTTEAASRRASRI
jgi:hypothetical protein